jgi:hypothetical protein
MNDLVVVDKGSDWRRLKALVFDSVSSPITKRVYNLGLDEFFEWYGQEPRPGFVEAAVAAWRCCTGNRQQSQPAALSGPLPRFTESVRGVMTTAPARRYP